MEAVLVTLLVSLLPGVAEELLFRGYAQTRFVERFGAPRGIALAAVFFALAHFDPQHVAGVLPIGVWLGCVAWLTRSTWISMGAHAINNIAGLALMHYLGNEADVPWTPEWLGAIAGLLALGAWGVVLARKRSRDPAPRAA